ncbi:hypothetical protein J1N35_040975 [Gossypium stocksii]|uniref:Uncharacterized protein n=1 Tax=Gossypium stocksii TaxID=47602 RepID=A0A9D3UEZ3_9ROSI|nr:hypothetical protein J1N35_040975 [Gossypium stocksii]
MEKHGWITFCLHPDNILTKVVKEFYVYLTSPKNAFIYVHGVSVLFDADLTNVQYGLPEGSDEHSQFVKTMMIEVLNQVLTDLYVEGITWAISRNRCYTIDLRSPTTHKRNAGTLNFSLLITTLCQRVKVPTQENEDKIPNRRTITKQIALRFLREEMPKYPNSISIASPLMTSDVALSTSHSNFEQKVIDVLDMLQQQFWMMEK